MALSLEGQTLGKYRVLESLGRGGMARVYRAYHPQLDRYVAIKVLRSDLVEEEEFLARFQREARAVAALRHPNIVQVYDFDVQNDVSYMVMELLEGDTLKVRLNDYRVRGEQMPLGDTLRISLDVLDGLAYAHSEGMVHRDIKSANIMLTRRGQAVVTDFGIAQIVGGTQYTAVGALMGTLSYMAPEQGLEGHSDARSDIYSLGIVLYEMLTQRTPFDADTPLAVLMKHLNDPLPLPRQIDPAIPEPFERVVLKALAKRPEDRCQSAEEMAQALREAAEAAGVALPDRISLPFSFTTAEAPSESVAVFSGTAREKIEDAQFATEDTDATLGQRLAAELAEGQPASKGVGKQLLQAMDALGQLVIGKKTKSGTAQQLHTMPAEPGGPLAGRRIDRAVLGEIGFMSGLAVIVNLVAVWVANLTGWWAIFEKGWPMELFLVSLGLCIIMATVASIWMLIPVGIILGNGLLFSYFALSGNWNHWIFLWPLELLLIIGPVFLTVWLAGHADFSRRLSRLLGWVLGFMAAAWSVIVPLAALVVPG
jgi:tRNA A-37 threonylcarbamoyl transferase component Bud32